MNRDTDARDPNEPINNEPSIISLIVFPLDTFTMNVPTAGANAKYHAQ